MIGSRVALCLLKTSAVKSRVDIVDVLLVHFLFGQLNGFAKSLEMHDLPLPQETDDVVHVGVVGQAEDVVIGQAGFLFWCDGKRTTF